MKFASFLIFAAAVFALALNAHLTYALTVGPAKIEYSLDPNTTTTGQFFLLNEGDNSTTLYPSFETFTEVNGEKRFLPGTPSEITAWFSPLPSVALAPHQSVEVPFTLYVPPNAPPGGHFAVVWWGTEPPQTSTTTAGQGTSIATRAGILVYINVSGQVNEAGTFADFGLVSSSSFFTEVPQQFNVTFKNTGNTYLKPQGQILIRDMLGMVDAVLLVNQYQNEVLPQSEKTLTVTPKSTRWDGFGFGWYHAELEVSYGAENNKQAVGELSFVAITWQIIVPIVLGVCFIIWLIFFGVKRYNRWIVRKALRNE